MTYTTPRSVVEDSMQLFSLPDIYMQMSEMVNDPRFTAKDMGQVIGKDPALSIRLLKVVNSSFYGFQAKIDTIPRAITIVGIEDLKHLVLATSVIDKFNNIPAELVDMTGFWLRSMHCAVLARLLAKQSSVLHSERLFLTGLLHDIGSLVLYQKMPDESRQVLMAADHKRSLVGALEQEIIGFTHAEVGAELIKLWGLPASVYEAIACYLSPDAAQVYRLDAYLLSLASRLTDCKQQGVSLEQVVENFTIAALSITRLDLEQIAWVMEQADNEFYQMFELMAADKRFH